jgi:serine acetyltransferase
MCGAIGKTLRAIGQGRAERALQRSCGMETTHDSEARAAPSETVTVRGAMDLSIRELLLLAGVEVGILCSSAWIAAAFAARFSMGVASAVALWVATTTVMAIAAVRALLWLRPMKPGLYRLSRDRGAWTQFRLFHLLVTTHVSWWLSTLAPPAIRPAMYALLGTRGVGVETGIAGKLFDPHLVTLGPGVLIGDEASLSPHAVTLTTEPTLLYAPIVIGARAVIGARSVVMPGVTVGEGSVVEACSFVRAFTRIGPGELWGGNPARLIARIDRRRSSAS